MRKLRSQPPNTYILFNAFDMYSGLQNLNRNELNYLKRAAFFAKKNMNTG